jgi:hypothetical protein
MTPYERVLHEMAATLRGPRRARQRFLAEIAEDLKDAIEAEKARGMAPDVAEAVVATRFGKPTIVADVWNSDQTVQRRAIRRNMLILMIAIATAGGLAVTQYASGKNSPVPSRCTRASGLEKSPCPRTGAASQTHKGVGRLPSSNRLRVLR